MADTDKRLKDLNWGKGESPEVLFSSWKMDLVHKLSKVVSEERIRPEFEVSIQSPTL